MRRLGHRCPGLLLWALALSSATCSDDVLTPSEAIAQCERDPTSMCCGLRDCGEGFECDFSVVCGLGGDRQVTCDRPTGDRQCHARCDANTPCLSGQMCQQVTIYDTSDGGRGVFFCRTPF